MMEINWTWAIHLFIGIALVIFTIISCILCIVITIMDDKKVEWDELAVTSMAALATVAHFFTNWNC